MNNSTAKAKPKMTVKNGIDVYKRQLLPYMDRPADTREGCKHRCTNAAMEYFKSEVMEMCHREGLYQIDLLSGSKEPVSYTHLRRLRIHQGLSG